MICSKFFINSYNLTHYGASTIIIYQVTANHHKSGGRNKPKHAKCSICKGATRGFVTVFLDLGSNDKEDGGGKMPAAAKSGDVINIDGDSDNDEEDSLEKLLNLWDGLWKELESLCGSEDNNSDDVEEESVVANDRRSDQAVANICDAIDLTQPSPPREKVQNDSTLLHNFFYNREQYNREQSSTLQYEKNQSRIQQIIKRLKYIHIAIMKKSQQSTSICSSSSKMSRQLEKFRSKVLNLQSANTDLTSQADKLQGDNDRLSSELSTMEQQVTNQKVAVERIKVKYESKVKDFNNMENSYQKYMRKTEAEKQSLHRNISKLQLEYKRLSNTQGIQDTEEMVEIQRKYSKMTNDLHNIKAANNKLRHELDNKERQFELIHEKEKKERTRLMKQIIKMENEKVGRTTVAAFVERRTTSSNDQSSSLAPSRVDKLAQKPPPSRSSTTISTSTNAQRGNKAMNALDRASSKQSRKPSNHLKRQGSPTHKSTYEMQNSRSMDDDQEESSQSNGVQLMMNTGKSKKRRHQSSIGVGSSIGNSSSREISGTENNRRKKKKIASSLAAASSKSTSNKRSCKVSATIETKGKISSFFGQSKNPCRRPLSPPGERFGGNNRDRFVTDVNGNLPDEPVMDQWGNHKFDRPEYNSDDYGDW